MNLRTELIKVAYENKEARADILKIVNEHDTAVAADMRSLLASIESNYTNLDETLIALSSNAGFKVNAKESREVITKMVGLTKKKISDQVDAYAAASRELAEYQAEVKSILDTVKNLKSVQADALKPLTEAAKQLENKKQICLEGQDMCLNMTRSIENKTPGVIQMMATHESPKREQGRGPGELFANLVAGLGEEQAKIAMQIVQQVKEDLTYTQTVIRAIKLVDRVDDEVAAAKTAGVLDKAKEIVSWLSGQANRLMNMAGSLKDWVKGLAMRTKICQGLMKDAGKSFIEFQKSVKRDIDDYKRWTQ